MNEEVERLRAAILQRCKTVYAFCGEYGLPKGTVYQVIRGKYAGDADKQLTRIWKALEAEPVAGPELQTLQKALAGVACQHCAYGKRRCRKNRPQCKKLWTAQAAAISAILEVDK